MKSVKTIFSLAAFCAFVTSASALDIPTSFVGDLNNNNDGTGYGGVSYGYHIGTYEVTNSQYVAFLNAKGSTDSNNLYSTSMSSWGISRAGSSGSYSYSVNTGFGDKPVNFVSFWDAARFSNWLTNGQGNGDTESGMYNLDGVTAPSNASVTRQLDFSSGQNGVAIASEDEWYKAAYYKGGSTTAGYWLYPTQSDPITTADANYGGSTVTDVGFYSGAASHYGTFDQGGNVWEWNDAITSTSNRGLRGGSFFNGDSTLQSSFRNGSNPTNEGSDIGFRVSSLASIPEPATYTAIFGCLALAIAIVRRKGRGTL